ncbi:MAG: cystathionine beta-lyase [Castellaniella sp.]|uniref:cystathionine beta-lyase n=1 Tax=Castellaniella sp. TaxID=1955812 RepID=UPI003C73CD35
MMSLHGASDRGDLRETQLTRLGRGQDLSLLYVNPPVVRGTTVLADSLAQWRQRASLRACDKPQANYGRFGTPTTAAFESAVAELDGAYRALCFPSGLAACTHALLAVCRPGGHVLISEFAYWPLREFAEQTLRSLAVEVEFFPELDAEGVAARFRPNTCAVYLEAPGSITFEICDVDHIAEQAHQRGIRVLMDNTWATSLLFQPLAHGVDIAIQSASKYIGGHSDCILGVASCNQDAWELLAGSVTRFGQTASPDDLYQGLRGLRTLGVRLREHGASALALARWLENQEEVAVVCSPGLESHPGHEQFKRLFGGVSGLFSFVFKPMSEAQLAAFFDSLRVFGIGLSWGGYESLVVPLTARPGSRLPEAAAGGQLVRVHAGLERVEDLIGDMERAFTALRKIGE